MKNFLRYVVKKFHTLRINQKILLSIPTVILILAPLIYIILNAVITEEPVIPPPIEEEEPPTLEPEPVPVQNYIPPPIYQQFAGGENWVVYDSLVWEILETPFSITIPRGFVTDLASSPRWAWRFYSPNGTYSKAAIIHDYLYWTQICTREQSDKLFLTAMRESDVSRGTLHDFYWQVRQQGDDPWIENREYKVRGLIKILTDDQIENIPPNASWSKYQFSLKEMGARGKKHDDNGEYCLFADSIEPPRAP